MTRDKIIRAATLLASGLVLTLALGCSSTPPQSAPAKEGALPYYQPTPEERRLEAELIEKQGRLGRELMETFTLEQLRKANAASLSHPDEPRQDPRTALKFDELSGTQQQTLRAYNDVYVALYMFRKDWHPDIRPPDDPSRQREEQARLAPVEETELFTIGYIWDQGGPDWKPFLDYAGYARRRGVWVGMFGCGDIRGGVEPTAAMKEAGINFREYPLMEHWEGSAAEAHYAPECGEGPYKDLSR